ncbi:MAG: hypothetical protein WCQ67_05855 [Treponema sp.]
MKKSVLAFTILALSTFICVSCASTKQEAAPKASDWQETELSDMENCGYFYTTAELGQFDMFEGEFKKATGYEKSAYGFVFGYTADDKGKLTNYIRFEINTDGEYALYKYDGKNYTDLVESNTAATAYFYANGAITKGYDATNTLKVELNSNGKYDVSVNGTKVGSNIERIKDSTYGAMAFFSVGSENQEKLPDQPVKVSYKITNSTAHKAGK